MNGDVKFDLATLDFKNGEQFEYFHIRILIIQQEIIISGEIFSPTRLLFRYMKEFSNIDKLRAFIAPKMIDLITLPDNNGKYAVYIVGDIRCIYHYLEMIGAPTIFTTSGHLSHNFITSYSRKNYVANLQPVIAAFFLEDEGPKRLKS